MLEELYVVIEESNKKFHLKQAFMNKEDAEEFCRLCGSPDREVTIHTYFFNPKTFVLATLS